MPRYRGGFHDSFLYDGIVLKYRNSIGPHMEILYVKRYGIGANLLCCNF